MSVRHPSVGREHAVRRGTARGDHRAHEDHERYFRTRDPQLRRRLLERYVPLAGKVSTRFSRSPQDREDLRQVALLGILHALDRFDPHRGVEFTTFAWATAAGELKRYRRDSEWSMHIPRSLQERYLDVAATVDELPVELGREPTAGDIADRIGESVGAVRECLDLRASHPVSLDRCITETPDAVPGQRAEGFGAVDERAALAWGLSRLRTTDRQAVVLHYIHGMTHEEVADVMGGSQTKASRAIARGLDHLRALLAPPSPSTDH